MFFSKIEKWTENEYVKRFFANLLLLIVFWGGLVRRNFTSDSITHCYVSDADITVNFKQGRYLKALFDWILLQFGIRTSDSVQLSMAIALVIMAITMVLLQYYFKKWEPTDLFSKIGYNLILNLWVVNVLFTENLLFVEVIVYFALTYFFAVLSLGYYIKKKYISMILSLIVVTGFYQYGVIYAALIIATYIMLEEKKLSWKIVGREMVAVFTCVFIGFLNLASSLLLVATGNMDEYFKDAGIGQQIEKIKAALYHFYDMNLTARNIFPKLWIPLLFNLVVLVMICYQSYKKKDFQLFLYQLILWAGGTLLLYIVPMAEERFSFPPRMSFCFFLLQGLMAACAYEYMDSATLKKWFTILCIGYVTLHLYFVQDIVSNHYISNALDEVYTKMVYEKIVLYEEETGREVQKICMFRDIDSEAEYEQVAYKSDQINEKSTGIVSVALLKYFTGRDFDKIELKQTDGTVYEMYFKDRDWDYFNAEEQVIIVDDVAYWCVF